MTPTSATPSLSARVFQPRVLLPVMIFVGVLVIGLRLDDLWVSATTIKPFRAVVPSVASTSLPGPAKAAEPEKAAESHAEPHAEARAEARAQEEEDTDIAPNILKQLKDRRNQLEQRSQELDARESLVKVAEQRIDQKMREMETLRIQLQTMVNTANAAQNAQLENLVKIYETMKAKEAAKIFETLDMPTLLGVVERMKPARIAPIMAEMAPDKAKDVTVALTRKDQLPALK